MKIYAVQDDKNNIVKLTQISDIADKNIESLTDGKGKVTEWDIAVRLKYRYKLIAFNKTTKGNIDFFNYVTKEKEEDLYITNIREELMTVLNYFGEQGWEFKGWEGGILLFRQSY